MGAFSCHQSGEFFALVQRVCMECLVGVWLYVFIGFETCQGCLLKRCLGTRSLIGFVKQSFELGFTCDLIIEDIISLMTCTTNVSVLPSAYLSDKSP